jgi:hypothetical protein
MCLFLYDFSTPTLQRTVPVLRKGKGVGVAKDPFIPLFSSYDPFSSRFLLPLVGFCHLHTHLTASLRGQNVLGGVRGELLLLCSTFTCLQHPILLYYTCCIKTSTTENLSLPASDVVRTSALVVFQTFSHMHAHIMFSKAIKHAS